MCALLASAAPLGTEPIEFIMYSTCNIINLRSLSSCPPGGAGVPAEVHEALRSAMEKLQHRFTSLMQEKADLKERVEELEHRCIQLSGETDTIGRSLVNDLFDP